jgi:GH24 family phage-related lysozyme (muramidase)
MLSVRWAVQRMATRPLSDGQFAALCDFAFNVGTTALRKSTLLKRLHEGRDVDVPAQFRRWVSAGGRVLPGLKTRREAEIALFFDGLPVPRAVPAPGEDLSVIDIRTGE